MLGLDFFKPREKFLLLEIAPRMTSGFLLSVDKERNIRAENFWENFSFEKAMGRIRRGFMGLRNQRGSRISRMGQIIVSAHPEFATNIVVPISLERDGASAEKPLSAPELENLFAQASGRMHLEHRGAASLRLGLDELDTVLVGARASDFKIDGHLVLNPLGFQGKTVSAILELAFTSRQIFDDLKEFFKAREGFFFTNLPRAALFVLSRISPPPIGLALIESEKSFYFTLDKAAWGNSMRENFLQWSLGRVFEVVSRELSLSPKLTFAVYDKFLNNETSPHFSRSLERALKPEKDALLSEIKKVNPRGKIYCHSGAPLPLNFPASLGRASLDELPTDSVLERFGFLLKEEGWPFSRGETLMRLAPFFEYYFDKSDSEINRRLRRRLHWLIQ